MYEVTHGIGKVIESRRDHRLNRRRERGGSGRCLRGVQQHPRGLDDEERIAAGALGDVTRRVLTETTAARLAGKVGAVVGGQWLEADQGVVVGFGAPGWAVVE